MVDLFSRSSRTSTSSVVVAAVLTLSVVVMTPSEGASESFVGIHEQ
jgi:hypothetical protein